MYHNNLSRKMFLQGVLGLNGQTVLYNLEFMQIFVLQKDFVRDV